MKYHNVRESETVEPLTSYFAGRLQQDLDGGNLLLGGMLTAVHRRIANPHLEFLHRAAYAGGLDFQRYWNDRSWYMAGTGLASHVRGSSEAIYETQTSSARYFQRPDADHLNLDPNRESLSGSAGSFRLGKSAPGRWRFQTCLAWRTPGFEINDLGYMRTADEINHSTWVGYYIEEPFSAFRKFSVNANEWVYWDFSGRNFARAANLNTHAEMLNNWNFNGGVTRNSEEVSNSALRGGPSLKFHGSWDADFHVRTDYRRMVHGVFGGWAWAGDDGGKARGGWFEVNLRPFNRFLITFNPDYKYRNPRQQYVGAWSTEDGDRYVFAELEQQTLTLTVRLECYVTPDLSLQYYGQPFVSAGSYGGFKRVADPLADSCEDRFHEYAPGEIEWSAAAAAYYIDENGDGASEFEMDDPDFNVREFNSNLVLRWEFGPGSILYLVWSQGRSDYVSQGRFALRRDLEDLFDVHPHNVFLLKVNKWFTW